MAEREERRRLATYQDVLEAPENMIAELIGGELFLQPRPAKRHTMVTSNLGMLLGPPFMHGRSGPGGWWILYEPELHLGGEVVVPDLAGWLRTETPDFDWNVAYYEERPAWVCEVLSPRTARRDRLVKLDIYFTAGVKHAWHVDPRDRTVEVFRWFDKGWLRIKGAADHAPTELEPFEAVPLELGLLWPPATAEAASECD